VNTVHSNFSSSSTTGTNTVKKRDDEVVVPLPFFQRPFLPPLSAVLALASGVNFYTGGLSGTMVLGDDGEMQVQKK
jgi:hypothetical protein